MRKLIITLTLLFAVAIVLPELRPLLLVGCVCLFAGVLLGARYGGKHYVELMETRHERLAEAKVTQ